ncbi:hypothetical protein FBU30_005432 [Linnemannia zychae]|nr:hypothetical protein FBU30_005432 [Linnemannia zychae]
MSRKGATNSKFGHLFGDSDNSSASNRESRLSGSGDLYKDPLAAFIPPITATTATARGGSSTAKATLSPPPPSSGTAVASRGSSSSPPTSGPNSRSSSRLQHHALFSSLTGGGSDSGSISGGSLFDSTTTPTLSAAKRDLLFGDGASSNTSSSRRTSTPPLSKNSATSTTQQSSRVPTPPMGVNNSRTHNSTLLDAEASPLGAPPGDGFSAKSTSRLQEEEDVLSPLSTAPLTRTNSQTSTRSHESVRSSKSARSQDVTSNADDNLSVSSSTLRSGVATKSNTSATEVGVAGVKAEGGAVGSPLIPSSSSTSSSTFSHARRAVTRTSMDHSQKQSTTINTVESASTAISDPIFNPLTGSGSAQLPPPPRYSSDWGATHQLPAATSSQSIDTFQSISRGSSPSPSVTTLNRPLMSSKSGFERDNLDIVSPTSSSAAPSPLSKSIPMMIPADDDAAAAFANDNLYSAAPSTMTPTSSSILDSGFSHSRASSNYTSHSTTISSSVAGGTSISATLSMTKTGIKTGTAEKLKSQSGFSLGEDVADSSNPWGNSLIDSLESTKLSDSRGATPKIVDYTQSEAISAFSTTTLPPSLISTSTSSTIRRTTTPLPPSLEDDVGGFKDVMTDLRSSSSVFPSRESGTSTPTPSLFPPTSASSKSTSHQYNDIGALPAGPTLSSWNILDAVEAAAQDPDFLGPTSIVNQSTAKVLAMMQMPKDALDKDVSAQEVFDNPWE